MTTKSQTDNTELDEIKKTVWECIRYNEFNLSDTEAVGVIMQAVEAKLKQQDIKSRIDELKELDAQDKIDPEHELDIPSYIEWRKGKIAKLRSLL